jgi:hypothetical protein
MEQKFNILTWFKGLSEGWRTITILSGFIVAVATTAIAIDHFKTKVANVGSVISYLQKQDSISTKRFTEITNHLINISDSLKKDFDERKVFQNNYSHLLWDKFGSEWMKYMNGMQVTVIQEPYLPTKSLDNQKPVFKMRIEKIDTTKHR